MNAIKGLMGLDGMSAAADAQAATMAKRQADLDAVEAGQKKVRSGGGMGMLGFIDEQMNGMLGMTGKKQTSLAPLANSLGGSR